MDFPPRFVACADCQEDITTASLCQVCLRPRMVPNPSRDLPLRCDTPTPHAEKLTGFSPCFYRAANPGCGTVRNLRHKTPKRARATGRSAAFQLLKYHGPFAARGLLRESESSAEVVRNPGLHTTSQPFAPLADKPERTRGRGRRYPPGCRLRSSSGMPAGRQCGRRF